MALSLIILIVMLIGVSFSEHKALREALRHDGLVTTLAKNSGLKLAGVVLCLVASLVAILLGVLAIMGFPNPSALIEAVIYLALGILTLIFSLRIHRRYNMTYAILLLVFSLIFIVLYTMFGMYAAIVGLLMLIGVILIFVAKA